MNVTFDNIERQFMAGNFDYERIALEAKKFFEWPTEDKSIVTTASAVLFARHIAMLAIKEIDESKKQYIPMLP